MDDSPKLRDLLTQCDLEHVETRCQMSGGALARGSELDRLFAQNREWVRRIEATEPGYFARVSQLQAPEFLWIGCSDSRVPANQIIGLLPGEVFVHRNVANVVVHTDLNCLSVIQFAVDVLKVRHVMVVGHYGCGGVTAALRGERVGLVDLWLNHVQDVRSRHELRLEGVAPEQRVDRLCELNVLEQTLHVCNTVVVQDAWRRGQAVTVHGWIYGLCDGLLRDLGMTASGPEHVAARYAEALARLG